MTIIFQLIWSHSHSDRHDTLWVMPAFLFWHDSGLFRISSIESEDIGNIDIFIFLFHFSLRLRSVLLILLCDIRALLLWRTFSGGPLFRTEPLFCTLLYLSKLIQSTKLRFIYTTLCNAFTFSRMSGAPHISFVLSHILTFFVFCIDNRLILPYPRYSLNSCAVFPPDVGEASPWRAQTKSR
jgi:hypothetical protein